MSPWVDAEDWVQEKFEELEKKRLTEIVVIFDKPDFQRLGIKSMAEFGSDAEKAVLFAKEWAQKGYKVLLVSPTEGGFSAWTVESNGLFHECKREKRR